MDLFIIKLRIGPQSWQYLSKATFFHKELLYQDDMEEQRICAPQERIERARWNL